MGSSYQVNYVGHLCVIWILVCSAVLILAGTPAAAQENLDVLVTANPETIVPGGSVELVVTVTYLREPIHDAVVQVITLAEGIAISMETDRTDSRGRVTATLQAGTHVTRTVRVTADATYEPSSVSARFEPLTGQGVIDIPLQQREQPPPENISPVAVVHWDGAPGPSPYTATISGEASYDPDGSIAEYRWDFGDGEFGSGAVVTHTYGNPGSYTVSLIVTDQAGVPSDPIYAMVQVTSPVVSCPENCGCLSSKEAREFFGPENYAMCLGSSEISCGQDAEGFIRYCYHAKAGCGDDASCSCMGDA